MLQNIRDNIQGVMAKIIIALIIVPFAFFGVESLLTGGGANHVAEVNGEDISAADLQQAVYFQKRSMLQRMGDNVDPAMLDEARLSAVALEQLVQRKLLLQQADSQNIDVSVAAVDQMILSMPQFQQDGQFSMQLYENMLRSNGYSLAYFKQRLTDDLRISQLTNGMAGSDFFTTQELSDTARIVAQTRSYAYITLPIAKLLNEVELSDQEIQQYYQQNQADFLSDEQVKLEYIEMKLADFAQPVGEAQLREAYNLEMADFNAQGERRAAHILFEVSKERDAEATIALAKVVADRIKAGESFADLAKEYSADAGSSDNAGDLGYTAGETFPVAFEEALFALELGQVSAPVETDAGIHLILAVDIKEAVAPTFEQRKQALEQRLQLAQAESVFINTVDRLRDLVFNSEGLAGPAVELKLDVRDAGWVSRASAEGVLASPRVLSAAFSDEVLKDRNNSEVLELASDHFIVVRVAEHKEAATKPLEKVRGIISARLSQQKATEIAKAQAEQLAKDMVDGDNSVADIASANGLDAVSEQKVNRSSAQADPELVAAIFALPKNSDNEATIDSLVLANGDVVVVRLSAVNDGSLADLAEEEQQGIGRQLQRFSSMQSLSGFQDTVRESAQVNIL